ncbi:MAG TPA: penicillin-binding protein 2 [Dermatophilaceae bacterium]|nr:penicillin-binding protein 2 [Dermatophilaceae bacterium]
MNNPIRRLAVLVTLMFCALLVASSIVQFAQADDLRQQKENRRTLLTRYSAERGSILVGSAPIARSEPVDDELKYLRTYPKGRLYSHVTGYYSFVYGAGGGLESASDDVLSGQSDALFYRRLGDLLLGRRPTGLNVEVTINDKAQAAADRALGSQRGAVVAIAPRTGAILAMVSHPQFDPNALSSHQGSRVAAAVEQLTKDPTKPLINRVIGGDLYPPGSTFKVVTAAAALSEGRLTEDSQVTGPAALKMPGTTVTLRNSGGGSCGGGTLTLTQAMQVSCNTAFGQIGMDLGATALREQAARFGFSQPLAIPITVSTSDVGPITGKPQEAFSAIGQQDVRVTPLQMAMIAAAVANDGRLMRPYLIQQTRGTGTDVVERTEPKEMSQPVSQDVADALTRMMVKVVDAGTGTRAQIDGVAVAGKSGTAEHGSDARGVKRPPHAWFISFAPADNPTVAVAVVVEDGGRAGSEAAGGRVSAPIAREVMKAVIAP